VETPNPDNAGLSHQLLASTVHCVGSSSIIPAKRLKSAALQCAHIRRQIELVENESAVFGLTNPLTLAQAFGDEHKPKVDKFFDDWNRIKQGIFEIIDRRLSGKNPQSDTVFRRALLNLFEELEPLNEQFVQLAAQLYAKSLEDALGQRHRT
jgi:hypothetical protein